MIPQEGIQKIASNLCAAIAQLLPQSRPEAILFGSYARGDADIDSDFDILILVDSSRQIIAERNWQVGSLAADILLDYGIVVSPIVKNRNYFYANVGLLPFYQNVQREGVRISA